MPATRARSSTCSCRKLRERMEAQAGVIGMTYSDVVPLAMPGESMPYHQLEVDSYVPAPNEQMILQRATVPPGYFKLMGIPLLEGRDFTYMDEEGKPLVIIVNETFAHGDSSEGPIRSAGRFESGAPSLR